MDNMVVNDIDMDVNMPNSILKKGSTQFNLDKT